MMDEFETLVTFASAYGTYRFLKMWYHPLTDALIPGRGKWIRTALFLLPFAALAIFLYTLANLAAIDVVGEGQYILMYALMGFSWLLLGELLMALCFDLSWVDDALHRRNPAAALAAMGGMLALTLIYSGANIGDGPGWWCVVFAGALGTGAFLLLGMALNGCAQVFERITVDRDLGCGMRTGAYLLASGIILARASGGDWTSGAQTIVEFGAGWPVLILTAAAIAVERLWMVMRRDSRGRESMASSLVCGVLYVAFAVVSVMLLPSIL